jgi:hypothetical protein
MLKPSPAVPSMGVVTQSLMKFHTVPMKRFNLLISPFTDSRIVMIIFNSTVLVITSVGVV